VLKATFKRERLHVTGQVQGVGFRPFVYRLARALGLSGYVVNDAAGATIEVQGPAEALEAFSRRLRREAPPLAHIRRCDRRRIPARPGERRFEIRPSRAGELADAQVTPDTATCADCLRELRDPADPRYRYPFINCTNCGPRYSIIRRIPYDRPNTTMADFAMCRLCAAQYADPADRRFHAQPVACARCGPSCRLVNRRGRQIACDDPIAEAARYLLRGSIVAIKGLGGFHLACRADDEHVVRRLRRRKNRDAKPFALMVRDLEQARRLAEVDAEAQRLLTGPLRPILLLRRRPDAPVAAAVAPGLDTIGIMLPYTPLHHLLLEGDLPALVMTSGNVSDEPLVKDNEDALSHLGRIADVLLLHNRRIQRSLDDSVVQVRPGGPMVFRRARGYAPQPVVLGLGPKRGSPTILAVGAELKSTVCLYRNGRAVLSEHIGDLQDGRTYRRFIAVINDLEALFDLQPELLVADLHPQYLSGEYARRRARGDLAGKPATTLLRVQHHHAHVVSCLAEHGVEEEVIGLACDGTGYGEDGAVWGCEVLRCDLAGYERLGHLRYVPLPGGDAAARETYRPAAAVVYDALGPDVLERLGAGPLRASREQVAAVLEQLTAGANCPPSSSLGRWFDAVARLAGLARENRYEGEAPMRLEAAIQPGVEDDYGFEMTEDEPFQIDLRPMVRQLVDDLTAVGVGVVAAKFHNTVAAFLAAAARRGRELTGLETVALSGGCFANRTVSARLEARLRAEGFRVLTHRSIPCNDGGVALGQAISAAARYRRQTRSPRRRREHVPGDTGKG